MNCFSSNLKCQIVWFLAFFPVMFVGHLSIAEMLELSEEQVTYLGTYSGPDIFEDIKRTRLFPGSGSFDVSFFDNCPATYYFSKGYKRHVETKGTTLDTSTVPQEVIKDRTSKSFFPSIAASELTIAFANNSQKVRNFLKKLKEVSPDTRIMCQQEPQRYFCLIEFNTDKNTIFEFNFLWGRGGFILSKWERIQ